MIYNQSGLPTAALVHNDALMDKKLYWVTCKSLGEVHYLLAIINSWALYEAVAQLMPKGQFGARDLEKHLWKLAIPEFDPGNRLLSQCPMRAWQRGMAQIVNLLA